MKKKNQEAFSQIYVTCIGYVELTLVFRKEGNRWTGFCKELGTTTYANDLKQTMKELKELVTLHLDTLEKTGLVGQFFSERKIKPKTMKIDFDSWFYKNCKKQRKREAKICQECPFRKLIEEQERRKK